MLNKRKLYTKPINPDTSTNENPINDHLIRLLVIDGLREIENRNLINKYNKICRYKFNNL